MKQPFFHIDIYPSSFYRFTHMQTRKLPVSLRDNTILPQSPYYQRHQNRKKERPTNHSGEPLYAQKPLILSHSSILSPASTQIPMASIQDSRLCRCYTLMTFTPLYPIYPTQFDIRQTGFDRKPLLFCGIRYKMILAERSGCR